MIASTLDQVAAATGGRVLGTPGAVVVSGEVVTDSRRAGSGGLFVALRGARVDGHHYLQSAADAGAVAALVSREVPGGPLAQVLVPDTTRALGELARWVLATLRSRPRPPLVVGVTGSVGKTSTKDLLAAVLDHTGEVIAPVGSYNNEIGLPLTVLRAQENTSVLVLEMGADAPGNLADLASIAAPDIAVVLAVGRAHLGGFGSLEAVAAAKSELVTHMLPEGVAILNADDERVAAMAPAVAGARTVLFGTVSHAQVRAEQVGTDDQERARFTLYFDDHAGAQAHPVQLALYGAHQVPNALAAAAVAHEVGVPAEQIATGLGSAFARSPHRMDVHRSDAGVTIIDDSYNANPDSMRAALRALARMAASTGGRAVAVLGPMRELGPDSTAEHERVGSFAAALGIQLLIAVDGAARPLATGALAAGMGRGDVQRASGVGEAVAMLRRYLRAEDVMLVKASNGERLWRVVEALERAR